MKDTPSVTSTCANCCPASRRSNSRSITAPSTATSSAPNSAASQKLTVKPSAPRRKRGAQIGADHEHRAVRQIRDPHQPEDQGESRRQQKQQAAERHAVDGQQQPERHIRRLTLVPKSCRITLRERGSNAWAQHFVSGG